MTRRDHERTALWLACLLGCVGVVWTIWSVPLVMTNDGPVAVLTAHMEAHYDDPGSIYARQFAIGFGLSGRGFSFLYRPLAALFSWPTSLRVSQLIMVLSSAFGVGALCRAVSGKVRSAALLGFVVAFSWPFYMGFWAFTIAMAFGLMVLAFVVSRGDGLTRIEKAAVSTALLVQLVLHGFAVIITLTLVGLVVMTRAAMLRKSTPPAEWHRATLLEAVWLAVAALPSVAVFLVMRTAQTQMSKVPGSDKMEWARPADWARVFPRLVVPGSTPLGVVIFTVAVIAIVRTVLRLRRGPRRPEEVALVIGAAGLLVASLAAPLNVPGWQFFSPRFLTTGLAMALCLLAMETLERRAARIAFDVGVVALVIWAIVSARGLHRRLATACGDALVGLEHRIARSSFSLPIMFDSTCGLGIDDTRLDVPYASPGLHFYSLFAVLHGGTVPYGFFGPAAVHAFVPRATWPVPIPPPDEYWGLHKGDPRLLRPRSRAVLVNELTWFGSYYENVVFMGANARDRAILLDRGYVIDFEQDSFINAHYVPCAVELVSAVLPNDPPVRVFGGVRDREVGTAQIAPTVDGRAIKASLSTFCGDIWVRVHWQGSSQRCTNADSDGRISVYTEHGQPAHLSCERQ